MLRFFYDGKVFVPESIELWYNTPDPALGGESDPTVKVSEVFKDIATLRTKLSDKSFNLERLMSTIIVINGHWDFTGTLIPGFFSINNSAAWRGTYKDIEVDATGTGELNDLIDLIWKREDKDGIVTNLVKHLKRAESGQQATPNIVFFSLGIPARGDVENLLGIYLKDRRSLIDFLYSTLSEKADPAIKDKITPLNRTFFIKAITEQKIVQDRLDSSLRDTQIIEEPVGSFTYIGKDRKAFSELYETFSERVFKPAVKELPRVQEVEARIVKGLSNIKDIV